MRRNKELAVVSKVNTFDDVFTPGNIVFLTNFNTIPNYEIYLLVEKVDKKAKIVSSSQVLVLEKEVSENSCKVEPLSNGLVLGNASTGKNNLCIVNSYMNFNIDRFDAFGILTNPHMLEKFANTFGKIKD